MHLTTLYQSPLSKIFKVLFYSNYNGFKALRPACDHVVNNMGKSA